MQYACQRNNVFILTDGFANDDTVTPPQLDTGKSESTWGAGAPYAANFSPPASLADLALRYYTNHLRADLPTGALQATPERRQHQPAHEHLRADAGRARHAVPGRGPRRRRRTHHRVAQPEHDAHDPTSVDDLWHATINGRGRMYLADDARETAMRIRAGLDDILSQEGAQGGIAVSAVNLDRSDAQAYLGVYNPRGWAGDLTANPIDIATAVVVADRQLVGRAAAGRARLERHAHRLRGQRQQRRRLHDSQRRRRVAAPAPAADREAAVQYLRGNRSGEGDDCSAPAPA